MPIHAPPNLRRLDQDSFQQLDYTVMRHVFDCQNELGRLCDEEAYQLDLAGRLEEAGLGPVRLEESIRVQFQDFSKCYEVDLVVADSAFYELKVAAALTGEHRSQMLNYLLLCQQPRGKLINLRPTKVQSEFVNSRLSEADRLRFRICTEHWQALSPRCDWLRDIVQRLMMDWGAFLEINLYSEAITHFLGGEQMVVRQVPMSTMNRRLGLQRFHLLTPDTAFRFTALTEQQGAFASHLRRLLALTDLRGIQWVNLNHHDIELITITREMARE
jgi:GxxExxY protein